MEVIQARNVHEAYLRGMDFISETGLERDSRAGRVLLVDGPVTTLYAKPTERVVFWPSRDANPFFHFMEGLWMLAGRRDVAWISQFSGNIAQFSDDGETFHGAYGDRWVNHFVIKTGDEDEEGNPIYVPFNQLAKIAQMLRDNPNERRCVLGMWNPEVDLGRVGKDVPCNTQIMFSVSVHGDLDMTVVNRSNDIIWGAYGANAVHFSMLQEFMAAYVGIPVGRYWQISNNWHAYKEIFDKHYKGLDTDVKGAFDYPYLDGRKHREPVVPFPMVNTTPEVWVEDLLMFMDEGPVIGFRDVFFKKVVGPIWNAWWEWKDDETPKRVDRALEAVRSCRATDWRLACEEWLERRRRN